MKKILAYFTASVLALASLPYSASAAAFNPFPLGDVDRDTYITSHDAAMVSRYILRGDNRLTDKQLKLADINRDGVVDQTDADLIHQQALENGYRLGDADLDGDADTDDTLEVFAEHAKTAAILNGYVVSGHLSKLQINLADMTGFSYPDASLDTAMNIFLYSCYRAAGRNFDIPAGEYDVFRNADGQRCYYFDEHDSIYHENS